MRVRIDLAALLCVLAACGGSESSSTGTNNGGARVRGESAGTSVPTGQLVQLQAAAFTASGTQIASPGIFTWSSSSSSTASVDQSGRVTGVAPGQAIISASVSGVSGTLAILVTPATAATKDTIFLLANTFSPPVLTIAKNTSVSFSFGGNVEHNVIFRATDPSGGPPNIQNRTSGVVVLTFAATGAFDFDCTVHPGMSGTITVK